MNYQKMAQLLNDALQGRNDDLFEEVRSRIHCMSTNRIYSVLNAIVSSMDPGELYFEVGTYQGGSTISALLHNEARAIAVDNFAEFKETNNFQQTRSNLDAFGVGDRVELIDSGFKDFFSISAKPDIQIQVYYYDGAHDYETQLAGMEAAWPYLAHGAIVLVDDYTYPEVNAAINSFISKHSRDIAIQFVFRPEQNVDPIWWNGCVVLRVL